MSHVDHSTESATTDSTLPPPRGERTTGRRAVPVWLALTALSMGGFALGTTEFATMGVLPEVTSDLRVSIPDGGHLISSYALGVVVGAPTFALLGARLNRRTLLMLLMGAVTLGNLLSAVAPTYPTLLGARFLSGLPHGAYFGIASVVAASLVPAHRRGRAVSSVMMGLTIANIVGVPISTFLGQGLGWRSTYVVVTLIGSLTVLAVLVFVPSVAAHAHGSAGREMRALRTPQVWLTLAVVGVGFGGFFAVYSYVSPTLTEVSGMPASGVPAVLMLFGVGMTLGNVVGGRLADRSLFGAIAGGLVSVVVVLLAFPFAAHAVGPAVACLFLLGTAGSLMNPALQSRLMDVAHEGRSLAAALSHSAYNAANALGAWLGGLVIAAGLGYTAPALVGAALAAAGLVVLLVSFLLERRERAHATPPRPGPVTKVPVAAK